MPPFPTCRRIRRLATALALGSLLQVSASQAAEYRFTPEPAYPPEVAKQIYQPLLDYLGKATGEKFVLLTSPNYSVYWRDILKPDQTDFSYDEAQFADYRIQHLQFVPVVRKRAAFVDAMTRQTGISADEARRLVVRGFFASIVAKIGIPEIIGHLMAAIDDELGLPPQEFEPSLELGAGPELTLVGELSDGEQA